MDRRTFLLSSSSFILANLLGLNSLSKAFAFNHIDQTPRTRPRLALIIDDIGASLSHAKSFLELEVPMTFAILPKLPMTEESASLIHKQGHEIMLHQPMEPRDRGLSPGPGALYVGDEAGRISYLQLRYCGILLTNFTHDYCLPCLCVWLPPQKEQLDIYFLYTLTYTNHTV